MPLDLHENGIDWQITETSKGSKRSITIHGYRRSQARLRASLSQSMLDASREIDRAYEDRFTADDGMFLGAKTTNLLASGGGAFRGDEAIGDKIERARKLKAWENACPKNLRDLVYNINQQDQTITMMASRTGKTNLEVQLWYKEGLRIYCKQQGWE